MSLSQLIRIVRQQLALVLMVVAATTAIAAAIAWTRTPVFDAHTQLFVAISGTGNLNDAYQAGLTARERARSYAHLVSSAAMTEAVAGDLGLPPDAGRELEGQLDATVTLDSVLINVTARDPSARRAADLANAVGRQLPRLVATLEGSASSGAEPRLVPKVASAAEVPTSPSSPRRPVYLAFGLLFGAMIGVAAALMRDRLAGRVHTEREAEAVSGTGLLGRISGGSEGASLGRWDGSSPELAEEYRQLSTALVRGGHSTALRLIVTSPTRGDGKTSVAANLAMAFAVMNRHVILVDANLRRPQVAPLFDVANGPGLTDVLAGMPVDEALHRLATDMNLGVLAAGSNVARPGDVVFSPALAELLAELETRADVLIVDSAAVLEAADATALARLGNVLLVTRLRATRVVELKAAMEHLRLVDATMAGLVATTGRRGIRRRSMRIALPASSRRASLRRAPRASERGRRGQPANKGG